MANEKPLDLSTLQAGLKRYDDSIPEASGFGANCSTQAGNQVKVVDTFQKLVKGKSIIIRNGTVISVYFSYGNSAADIYLNVDGSGPKRVVLNQGPTGTSNPLLWTSGAKLQFMCISDQWHYIGQPGSYVCTAGSAADEAYKVASVVVPIVICFGTRLTVVSSTANTYDDGTLYLRFNDIDTAKIYRNNTPTTPDNTALWNSGEAIDLIRIADHWELVGEPGLSDAAVTGDYNDLINTPDIAQSDNDEFISIEIDEKYPSSAYSSNDDVILFRNFTDYCVHNGIGNKIGAKIIIGSDEYTPDSISVSGSATWIIDSANLTVHLSDTTIPTGLSTAVLPQIEIYPTDSEGDLTAFSAISAGTIVQISIPAIAYAVVNNAVITGKNLDSAISNLADVAKSGDYYDLDNRPDIDIQVQTFEIYPNSNDWYAEDTINVEMDGYTVLGIVGHASAGADVNFYGLYRIDDTRIFVGVSNVLHQNFTGQFKITVFVLYMKNI